MQDVLSFIYKAFAMQEPQSHTQPCFNVAGTHQHIANYIATH